MLSGELEQQLASVGSACAGPFLLSFVLIEEKKIYLVPAPAAVIH